MLKPSVGYLSQLEPMLVGDVFQLLHSTDCVTIPSGIEDAERPVRVEMTTRLHLRFRGKKFTRKESSAKGMDMIKAYTRLG